jgi:hypothetical protein
LCIWKTQKRRESSYLSPTRLYILIISVSSSSENWSFDSSLVSSEEIKNPRSVGETQQATSMDSMTRTTFLNNKKQKEEATIIYEQDF